MIKKWEINTEMRCVPVKRTGNQVQISAAVVYVYFNLWKGMNLHLPAERFLATMVSRKSDYVNTLAHSPP